jgi:hypothetical protein
LQAGATKTVLSLGENYTGVRSHWSGRTLLCPGTDDCPGCLAGLDTRWLGYLPVIHNRNVYALLEISAQATPEFDRLRDDASLHNMVIEMRKGRRFEPIKIVRAKLSSSTETPAVESVQVIDQLARILGLPRLRPGEEVAAWELRLQTVATARLTVAVRARG